VELEPPHAAAPRPPRSARLETKRRTVDTRR
jgi:hypothetical protein